MVADQELGTVSMVTVLNNAPSLNTVQFLWYVARYSEDSSSFSDCIRRVSNFQKRSRSYISGGDVIIFMMQSVAVSVVGLGRGLERSLSMTALPSARLLE